MFISSLNVKQWHFVAIYRDVCLTKVISKRATVNLSKHNYSLNSASSDVKMTAVTENWLRQRRLERQREKETWRNSQRENVWNKHQGFMSVITTKGKTENRRLIDSSSQIFRPSESDKWRTLFGQRPHICLYFAIAQLTSAFLYNQSFQASKIFF